MSDHCGSGGFTRDCDRDGHGSPGDGHCGHGHGDHFFPRGGYQYHVRGPSTSRGRATSQNLAAGHTTYLRGRNAGGSASAIQSVGTTMVPVERRRYSQRRLSSSRYEGLTQGSTTSAGTSPSTSRGAPGHHAQKKKKHHDRSEGALAGGVRPVAKLYDWSEGMHMGARGGEGGDGEDNGGEPTARFQFLSHRVFQRLDVMEQEL